MKQHDSLLMGPFWFLAKLWAKSKLRGNTLVEQKLDHRVVGPAIVIANHVTFYDWALVSDVLRIPKLHVVMTRYFFDNKLFGWALKCGGCIPKLVFCDDKAAAIGMIKVLKHNGVLLLFPEARLGALSRTEAIPSETARFLKRIGVPVYGVHIDGGTLAVSKWGGKRTGGTIGVKAKPLFTSADLKRMSTEETIKSVENFLFFDDYAWLSRHPELHYRSPHIAEGLEQVLWKCPQCGESGTLTTHGDTITCTCGFHATVDDRFGLSAGFPTVQAWQIWCVKQMEDAMHHPSWNLSFSCALSGESGICTLDAYGLVFQGKTKTISIPKEEIVIFPFSTGKNFVIFRPGACLVFVPSEPYCSAECATASGLLSGVTPSLQTR